jgi:hypothetical protein
VIDPSHPIRGRKWNGKNVLVIYDDPTRGQYYIHPVTQSPIYYVSKPHLADGQDWHDTGQRICTFPHVDRKAIHEAGHAAICFLEGIKVEYITIEPHEETGLRLDGVCQWDHGIVARRNASEHDQAALCAWAEKEAKVMLGGITAERRFLREKGLPEEPLNDYAWTGDFQSLEKRIEHRATHLGIDHKANRERVTASVLATMQDERVWNGVQRIAAALTRMGAISGKQAEHLFKG